MGIWVQTKNKVRIWIEQQRGNPRAPFVAKLVASLIWSVHIGRSLIHNGPRLLRIWLTLNATKPNAGALNPIYKLILYVPFQILRAREQKRGAPQFDETRVPPCPNNASTEAKIAALESYANEVTIGYPEREELAARLAKVNQEFVPNQYSEHVNLDDFATLKRNGFVPLSNLDLTSAKVQEVVDFLKTKPVYAAHLPVYSDGVARAFSDPKTQHFPFGSYNMSDVVPAPHLLELAFDPRVLALAEAYFGCVPSLYSMHSWWSFPGHITAGPQSFHRDLDDHRFLALFVFLTDVEGGAKGGEHDYVLGTHRLDTMNELLKDSPGLAEEFFYPKWSGNVHDESALYRRIFGDKIRSVTGKAGSVFLADVYGLHRGVKPTQEGRLVCWIRFGLRKNWSYKQDKTSPVPYDWNSGRIPNTAYHRHVGRLLI